MFVNSYVDFSDYEQPIKTYLDDRYSYYIKTDIKKYIRAHVRNNNVNLMDSLLDIGNEIKSNFYSIEKTDNDFYDIYANTYLEINLTIDPNVDLYERKVYSFFDLTGQLGGLYEVLHTIIGIIVGLISSRILVMTMMSNLYYIYSNDRTEPNDFSLTTKAAKHMSFTRSNKALSLKNDELNSKALNISSSTSHPIYHRNSEILSTDVKIEDIVEESKSVTSNPLENYDKFQNSMNELKSKMVKTKRYNYSCCDIICSFMQCTKGALDRPNNCLNSLRRK